MSTTATTILLTCRECGGARDATRHYIQDALRVRAPGRITVDWERAEAIHTCRECTKAAEMRARIAATVKRGGRRALVERGKRLAQWNAEHPEARQAQLAAAQAALKTWQPSELDKARNRLGRLRLDMNGRLSLCGICHRLLFMESRHIERFKAEERENIGRFHQTCLLRWRGSETMRAWVSACRRAGAAGEPKPEMPVPPRPADRLSSESELAEAYVTTVRYFWQREGSGRAERDERGQVQPIAWLARHLDLSRRALYNRVQRFLSLLPDETDATGRTAIWRDVFLALNTEKTGVLENVTQVAQPHDENVSQGAHL